MSIDELPLTWATVDLEELLAPLDDGRVLHQGWSPQCEAGPAQDGEWGVLKTTAIQAGRYEPHHNKRLPEPLSPRTGIEVHEGDLLLTCAGPRSRCGVPALVRATPSRLMLSGKMYRFRANSDLLLNRYLELFLLSPQGQQQIEAMKTGISDSGLNLTRDRFFRLSVPVAPVAEQNRIVDDLDRRLSHVDAAERTLKVARQKLEVARAGVLWDAVLPDGAGVPSDDGSTPLPSGWDWTTLGAASEVIGGVTKDSKNQSDERFIEVPYLRVANVQRGYLDLSTVTTIRVSPEKAQKLRLERGDILFNEGGDRDKLGRGWVWEEQIAGCIHQNHVFRARLTDDRLHPRFVSWCGNTYGQRWFETNGKQTTNLASLNLTTLKSFPVPVPPRALLPAIVDEVERRLTLLDAATRSVSESERRCKQLRRTLLREAFRGKLTHQLEGEASTRVALDAIRTARQESAIKPKRRARSRSAK